MKWIILIIILIMGVIFLNVKPKKEITLVDNISIIPTPTIKVEKYVQPVKEFEARVTKKKFGLFVTPDHSPVLPERFSGFHTGVDVEYGDVEGEVEVMAIDEGIVVQVGKVKGYGGVVIVKHQDFLSLYGHVVPGVVEGQEVKKGEKIAILGKGYSSDTDGERKHLHFGIIKGDKVDLRGYAHDRSDLDLWIDPMSLF